MFVLERFYTTLVCVCVCVYIGNLEDKTIPTPVRGLSGHKIVGVACGSGDAHTIALEDNGIHYTIDLNTQHSYIHV